MATHRSLDPRSSPLMIGDAGPEQASGDWVDHVAGPAERPDLGDVFALRWKRRRADRRSVVFHLEKAAEFGLVDSADLKTIAKIASIGLLHVDVLARGVHTEVADDQGVAVTLGEDISGPPTDRGSPHGNLV